MVTAVNIDDAQYNGVAGTGALRADRAAGDQLYQLANGQMVAAGSAGTQGDKGYYTENAAGTQADQAAAAQAQTTANTNAATAAAATATQQQNANNAQSATALINSFFSSIPGLSQLDPTGQLQAWANGQITTLSGQGMSGSDIQNQIESTINNPMASGDAQAQQVFDQLFPGYNQKIANGTSNANGQYTGIAGYIAYNSQVQAMASVADIPGGLSAQTVGDLWANNVSSTEVSDRITQGYVAANNAWNNIPGFAQYMSQNYGLTQGGLAAYYLDENNAVSDQTLQTGLNQGTTAGEAGATGFGNLTTAQAQGLSSFLAMSNQSGLGGIGSVSGTAASNAFTGNLGGNVQGSAAQLAAGGYEQTSAGQSSTGTVSQDTLLAGIEGNASALQQTAQAQEARTAGSKGGGGATATANGAVGLGYANS